MLVVLFSSAAAGVMATRTGAPTQTTTNPAQARERAEVTSRFTRIMAVRQRALLLRDMTLLRDIYTPDSPQLHKDRTEIKALRTKHRRWVGMRLPVQVLKATEVSSRRWTVVALLGRSDARLEFESGELIREVPGNRQVYWCTLIKDPAKGWLLYNLVPP